MIYTQKTNGFIEIHDADAWQENKKYYVANGARSAVKNFSKNVCA
jgi:aspartyl aminopeptidase